MLSAVFNGLTVNVSCVAPSMFWHMIWQHRQHAKDLRKDIKDHDKKILTRYYARALQTLSN